MRSLIIIASIVLLAGPAIAGDHGSHPPMAPPLSATCALLPPAQQYACLHPGYTVQVADLRGLSLNIATGSGAAAIKGFKLIGGVLYPIYWH